MKHRGDSRAEEADTAGAKSASATNRSALRDSYLTSLSPLCLFLCKMGIIKTVLEDS